MIKIVELNSVDACTRHCSFCPRADASKFDNNFGRAMTPDVFLNVVKAFASHDLIVVISGFGEPMMNPHIWTGLDILSCHFPLRLITNFDVFTEKSLRQLNKYKLNLLKVDLYDERIATRFNKLNHLYTNPTQVRYVYKTKESNLDFYNRAGNSTFTSNEGLNINRHCNVPYEKIMIDYDGTYLQCMSDWSRQSEIAQSKLNIKDYTLDQYMETPEYKHLISSMETTRRKNLAICKTCDIRGSYEKQDT